jgi:hypothetical protein
MSFQWIIDNASELSINRKRIVASSQARNGLVRAVSRGTQPRRIEVRLPDGVPWTDLRTNIIAAEALDRYQTATISIPYAKFPWYYGNTNPGTDESYTVICVSFPEWIINARDQVGWSGPFVFMEVVT